MDPSSPSRLTSGATPEPTRMTGLAAFTPARSKSEWPASKLATPTGPAPSQRQPAEKHESLYNQLTIMLKK